MGISAQTDLHVPQLLQAIEQVLDATRSRIQVLIPYTEGKLLSQIHSICKIIATENKEEGTYLELYATEEILGKVEKYMQK